MNRYKISRHYFYRNFYKDLNQSFPESLFFRVCIDFSRFFVVLVLLSLLPNPLYG